MKLRADLDRLEYEKVAEKMRQEAYQKGLQDARIKVVGRSRMDSNNNSMKRPQKFGKSYI